MISGYSPTCTLNQNLPETSSCNQTSMTAGYNAATKDTERALIQFSLSSVPKDITVISSKLSLYVASETDSSGATMGAWRVTTPWEAGATWNTTNGKTPWKETKGGDYEVGKDGAITTSVKPGWTYFYPTLMTQEWINGPDTPNNEGAANYGLLLKSIPEGSESNQAQIETPSEGTYEPYLQVEYAPRDIGDQHPSNTVPVRLSDKMGLGVNTGSGNLTVQNEDLSIPGTGLDFNSERTWNSQDRHIRMYGMGWSDSNLPSVFETSEGSVGYRDPTGAWFLFLNQYPNFVTPAGIQATLCRKGSAAPCPSSLPEGVAFRLIYNQSQTHIDFKSNGLPVDVQDRFNNTLTAHYTAGVELPTSWTDTRGRTISYKTGTADGATHYTNIEDESGKRSAEFQYNGSETEPLLTKYRDTNEKTTEYEYTGGLLTQITDADGHVTKISYDSENRVTKIIRVTNSEKGTGPTTTFTYDELGKAPSPCTADQKATIVKDPDWTAGKAHETVSCVNTLDEVEKTVDANGNATESSYNPFGETTETTAAAPGSGESGGVESLNYDETGHNLLCSIQGTSSPETKCPSTRDKSALVASYSYIDATEPFSATQAENANGNSTFGCLNKSKMEYKSKEEETRYKCPAESTSEPANVIQNENDQLPSEHELKFTYNANGTVKTSTDADGRTTSYEYDEKGNLKKIIPPAPLSPTTITVDADSRPHIITDGASHTETISYDRDDRIIEIVYAGTGTAKTVKFEYDADGNLMGREDPTGKTTYAVDDLGRLIKERLPGEITNSYEYDEASNMTAFSDSGGTTKYKYNGLNELESMLEPSETKETKFAYNNDHQLDKITYPSGAIENYKLEPTTGRPETITVEGVTGTTVPKLTYAYKQGENDTSLIESLTESTGNTTTYAYDALDRLTKAATTGTNPSFYKFKLDGAGNRLEQKVNLTKGEETGSEATFYTNNAGNETECRQTVAPVENKCSGNSSTELSHYTYDGAGDETAITPKSDTSGATFAYNAADELSTLTPSGSSALALSYGGKGQNDLTAISTTTTLQNSLLGLTRETNSSGTSYFARTPTGLLIDERTPSGHYNPLYDAQGDIIGLVSATAKVERTFRYGPYGENIHSEGTQTIPYPFGYKGGYRMPAGNTGKGNVANSLIHFGQRYYDPTTGRWTQQDPADRVASATQGDRFLFGGADPINEADPSGEGSFTAACVTAAIWCGLSNSGDQILSYPSQAAEQASAWAEKAGEYIEPTPEEEEIAEEVIEDL